jgi:DNA invertase Pin-like site-specific DNA recombinase
MVGTSLLWNQVLFEEVQEMKPTPRSRIRCAVYTRKSSEEGLEQSFNSLQAQREACESYIASQRHEGCHGIKTHYDDGGFSGGTMDRPALRRLLEDIASGKIDIVVVYKVDRLTRSLADFAKIVEAFDRQGVSFVSVTQQFNTTTSMGRLTLNVLLPFAQFEREVTGERIRDKVTASKKKWMWNGGPQFLWATIIGSSLIQRKPRSCARFSPIICAWAVSLTVLSFPDHLEGILVVSPTVTGLDYLSNDRILCRL